MCFFLSLYHKFTQFSQPDVQLFLALPFVFSNMTILVFRLQNATTKHLNRWTLWMEIFQNLHFSKKSTQSVYLRIKSFWMAGTLRNSSHSLVLNSYLMDKLQTDTWGKRFFSFQKKVQQFFRLFSEREEKLPSAATNPSFLPITSHSAAVMCSDISSSAS